MKEKTSNWPFFGAVLLFVVNVDFMLLPVVLKPLDLSFWAMFWIAMPIANLEILGWFFFWRWFAWKWLPQTEPVKDTVELQKNLFNLLEEYGLLETVIYEVRKSFKWATKPDQHQSLKKWGHAWMLFLGVEPFFTGGRFLGVISCGATRWKAGLVSLCIGNIFHVYISIKSWDLIFYLWDGYWEWIIGLTILAVLFMARGFIWRKLSGGRKTPKSP